MEFRSPVCIFVPVILVVLCVGTLTRLVRVPTQSTTSKTGTKIQTGELNSI